MGSIALCEGRKVVVFSRGKGKVRYGKSRNNKKQTSNK